MEPPPLPSDLEDPPPMLSDLEDLPPLPSDLDSDVADSVSTLDYMYLVNHLELYVDLYIWKNRQLCGDWKKHWFVLTGNSLRYYKDAKAEENNALDGRIDLSGCYDISEVNIGRNYGFRVKTRNGEYLLSAMTSGIRNNWMKAIRLVMDLQTSGGAKRNSNVSESDSSLSPRTGEEIDSSVLNSSNASSVIEESALQKEVSPKVEQKKAAIKPTRRHNSDVNPGNVSKMLKIKDLVGSLERIDIPPATVGMVTVETGEAKKMDDVVDSGSHATEQEGLMSADGMPVGRYVEGSDDIQYRRPIISESKKEEERKRRGKSPSARVKEKSRAKSPKLMSPPPDSDDNYGYQMSIPSVDKFQHDGGLSASSGDELTDHDHLSQDVYQEGHLQEPDHLLSTASSAGGDGMLVELLETEVDSLKDQLEQSQQELVKMHESNRDLKTKLQTVVREKDLAQPQHGLESPLMRSLWKQQNVNTEIQENNNSSSNDNEETTTLRRQLKEARDTIQKQRNDADSLRSKLDMSVSKLSGTEKALSEALKDLKQEKDKTMKISNDWNKKVRNLEGQIRDVNVKLERQKDAMNMKDKECRRLEIDLKTNLQKIREHEREILKLKAVEHEYKQTKEKLDELERKQGSLKEEIKERDKKYKKMEQEYSSQIADMEQEFSQERDALDQHIEELKKKLCETQQKPSVSNSIPDNIADILKDKDEIISQLEEKLIESDKRMLEMSDEIQAEVDENATLQDSIKALNFDRKNNEKKMKEVEKLQSQLNTQKQSMENENSKMKSKIEELKKEKMEFGSKLEAEKLSALKLMKEKEELQKMVNKLKSEMKLSPPSPQKSISQDSHHSVKSVDDEKYKEMIQNFIVVDSEMSDISGSLDHLRKTFNEYLSSAKTQKTEQSPSRLENILDTMEEISHKCESLQEILKEGRKELDLDAGDGVEFKTKYENAAAELENLQKEVTETRNNCKKLQNSEKILQEKVTEYENNYKKQVALLASRIDNVSEKLGKNQDKNVKTSPGKQDQNKTTVLSEKIEDELKELEHTIGNVEKLLDSQNFMLLKHSSDEVDDETEEEESDDGFTSSDDDDDEESEDDEINPADVSKDSRDFMLKLQQIKDQLEKTNIKMKDITSDMGSLNESSDSDIKQSLCKYSDKINSLSSRLSEKVTSAKSGGVSFDGIGNDNTIVFQQCVQHLHQKLVEMGHLVDENESLDAKGLKSVKQKVGELGEYLGQLHKLEHQDFDLMGKIAKQEARSQALLYEKGRNMRRSRLSYDEKLSIYADRLAVESIVLGQMAYMVQERQMVNLYRDVLMREIKEVNAMILDLAKCIDDATREAGFHNGDLDVVSSYAALLAEKIVLEGQLASCTMAAESHNTDDTAILTSLQISDNPSILAMEVFLRSQLDSSINQQIQEHSSPSHSDVITGHIVTRSLVQGELTHALQKLKSQFNTQVGVEDIVELLKRERQFSHDQLLVREESICNSVDMFHSVCLSCLRYHIQKTQAHVPQLVDTLCQKVTEHFHSKIQEYQEKLNVLEGSERRKHELICEMLQSELSLASSTLQQLNEVSQPELSDEDYFDLNIHSAEATVIQMCDILIQRAVVCGSVAHVKELFRTGRAPQVSDIVSSTSDSTSDVVAKNLSQMLETEAANKQSLSAELKLHGKERTEDSDYLNRMVDLIGVVPDMGDFSPENLTSYAQHLVREALFQSQLTYTTYKLKLQHEHDMRDLKIRIEAGQKVELPSETCKDTESDIQASLSVFEEILETKFEDECEVLSILDKEIKQLKLANANKSTVDSETFEKQLQTLANTFEHELSVVQERHDIHLDVLRQEISNICIRLEKVSEDHEKEKETLSAEYEERIMTLQDEMECIKGEHEEELEQVRQDIMTAVSAIRANDETSDDQLSDQVKLLNSQLASQIDNSIKMLEEIQKLPEFEKNPSLAQKLKEYIRKIRLSHPDPEQQSMPLSPKPVPVFTLQEDEEETTSAVIDTSTGEPSENASSQQLDISHHEQELELLKKEKEEALAEEVKTTKAALEAMRKAYEEDLEIEKDKYREALKTMYTDDYFQEIRHRYETEVHRLSEELKQTTMHYDSKCEDYKLLEDKIDRMKTDYDAHTAQLVKSNEQLNSLVNEEIGKLKEFIQNRTMASVPGNATIEEELYDAQINVRVKDAELQKLRGQEQRHSMTQYYQLHKKYQDLQAQLKQSLESKQEKEIQARDARSLRRTPSFHHRARSPSPQLATSSKGDKEHHSRESNRRSSRHLDARDLKRSKSSPSIPYIMDRRLSGKNSGLKAAKVPKSQKS
ncbi:hypothetical protein KUTeg_003359 [Tegillarca granosa]|uniref:PH domain-containing protein n=1 Tax=Tegillarca granosa TaxID=220873 RepID=A0ABQ9FRF9_TEGGR|nr:hypothetical protein KUTeg_003359 [Tegillarca granosa]